MKARRKSSSKVAAAPSRERWWLYLLECGDGRIYCGIAKDLRARFDKHRAGTGAKFTRGAGVARILGARRCAHVSAALKAEHALKKLPRARKLAWARQHPWPRPPRLRYR